MTERAKEGRADEGLGGRECGRVRKREPKLATFPKCPSSVTCAAATESKKCSQGDRAVEKARRQKEEDCH